MHSINTVVEYLTYHGNSNGIILFTDNSIVEYHFSFKWHSQFFRQ
jgi:hypothetical protein